MFGFAFLRGLILAALVLAMAPQAGHAFSPKCSISGRFDTLFGLVGDALRARSDITARSIQNLANNLNREEISRRLESLDADEVNQSVTVYLQAVRTASSADTLIRDPVFRLSMAKIHAFMDGTCPARLDGAEEGDDGTSAGDAFLNAMRGGDSTDPRAGAVLRTLVFMALALGGLGLIIGIVQLVVAIQEYMVVRLKRRKICRIGALFRLGARGGDPLYLGNITMIDEAGCRFQPDNPQELDHIAEEAARRPISLICHGYELPGHVYRIDDLYAGVLFDLPLPSALQDELLSHSNVIPEFSNEKRKISNVIQTKRDVPRPIREIDAETLLEYHEQSTQSGDRREDDGVPEMKIAPGMQLKN